MTQTVLEWFSVDEKLPDTDRIYIACQMNGNDVVNQSLELNYIHQKGSEGFYNGEYEKIEWQPTHWAYIHYPYPASI